MNIMDKPTLQEVKEYFKNAKEVRCLAGEGIIDISDIDNFDKRYIHLWANDYWICLKHIRNILLYDSSKREYAEIISYKEPLYQLTAKELRYGAENPQWLKDTFKECFVDEYTIPEAEEKFNIKIKAV